MPTSKTKELAKKLGLLKKRKAESGHDKSRKRRKGQLLSYVIVLDFESTCWKDKKGAQEIIEFPAVVLDLQTGDVVAQFQQYVQPRDNPILSDFCKELTGISQAQVDGGVPVSTCLYLFGKWVRALREEKGVCLMEPGQQYSSHDMNLCALATWSDWDLAVCLQYECRRKQIRKPAYFDQWIDLRIVYKQFYDCKPSGLCGSLKDLGIPFIGREHCGLDDARNTAKLCYRLVTDGCRLNITKSIWKKRPVNVVRAPGTRDILGVDKENDTARNATSHQSQIIPPKSMGTHLAISESKQDVNQADNTTGNVEAGTHRKHEECGTTEQTAEEDWNESFLNGIVHELEELENNYSDIPTLATHQEPHCPSESHIPAKPMNSISTRYNSDSDNTPSRLRFFPHITPVTLLPAAQNKPSTHSVKLKSELQQQQPTTAPTLHTPTVPICQTHNVTGDKVAAIAEVGNRVAASCISFRTPSTTQWIKVKSSHSHSPSLLSSPQPFNGGKVTPPLCNCGKRAKRKTVTSPGPNQGKPFFSCSGGRETGCQYFKWETSSPHGVNHSSDVNLSSEYD